MMRNLCTGALIAFFSVGPGFAAERIETCELSPGLSAKVSVTIEHPISDTNIYKLHSPRKTEYFFDDEESSRGGPVSLACVAGKKQRVFVAYGEFTANYPKGFVLTYNRPTDKIERLDFAQKGEPEWLYLGENEFIVILSTYGAGENGSKPYVAYRHITGRTEQPAPESLEVPTPPTGYEIIKLKK